ncbi:MAG: threonine dehydratase [Acidimicrobiales bacterium]|nr:threonine dehydratase [Acidimicrobiales bacterium]
MAHTRGVPDDAEAAAALLTLDDVEAAAATIAGQVVRTPSAVSQTLSELLGATVVVKFENLQFTAAFKERGALNRLANLLPTERAAGVVAVSAGNHAQAVAHHARRLGIEATIVMPVTTPFVKVVRTRQLGATVELVGPTLAEAMARGLELVEEGRCLVHPYDDPLVIAGQGTAALELLTDHPELDALLVPVGGGGLVAGSAVTAAGLRPDLAVYGVQVRRYDSMVRLLAGSTAPVPGGPTLADGIAVADAGGLAADIVSALGLEILTVDEESIEEAVYLLLEIEKVVVEGAGAAGIAALIAHRSVFAGRTVGVLLSGGNIDPRVLASVITRGLIRSGRMSMLRVSIDDRPGTLAALLEVVGSAGGNLLEVQHQRLFTGAPIRSIHVDLLVETMDTTHRARILEAIRRAGHEVELRPLSGSH